MNGIDDHVRADNEFYDDPKDIDHDDGVKKEDACVVSYKSNSVISLEFPWLSTRRVLE